MAVNLQPPGELAPVAGVRLAVAQAGIRYQQRDDLVLLDLAPGSQVAAVFTRNAFCAAPVLVARQHLQRSGGEIRGLLINSGNANAGTGQAGLQAARRSCMAAARLLDCPAEAVLPFSTGVIGEALPVDRIESAMPRLAAASSAQWLPAARAIMTTDTMPKAASRRMIVGERTVTITGMAKGAGMICPDMATMLAYVACDAQLEQGDLQALLVAAVGESFNRITIDGDTSTNDACVLIATGQSGVVCRAGEPAFAALRETVTALCVELAQAVVRDGEGATRLLRMCVEAAADTAEARAVAYTVAHSPLVKTAAFAGDPNWGRILAAVGRSGVENLDISKVDLYLGEVCVLRGGEPAAEYREALGAEVAARAEYSVRIVLGRGAAMTEIWTSDFSYEYVRINAEYRS